MIIVWTGVKTYMTGSKEIAFKNWPLIEADIEMPKRTLLMKQVNFRKSFSPLRV